MSTSDITPTVVLVHGAFVDASSWTGDRIGALDRKQIQRTPLSSTATWGE